MHKLLSIILTSFLFFLSGCSSYSITKYFDKDEFYLNSLQYTKKADIVEKEEVAAIFTATYLNKVDKKYNDNYENFIISIYKVNNNKNLTPIITIDKPNYSEDEKEKEISYEKSYVQIEEIKKESKLIESIPLKNPWAKYYLIKFEKNEEIEKLLLTYKINENQKAQINF